MGGLGSGPPPKPHNAHIKQLSQQVGPNRLRSLCGMYHLNKTQSSGLYCQKEIDLINYSKKTVFSSLHDLTSRLIAKLNEINPQSSV